MDIDKMLDVYIHDYLVKRKLIATAKVFAEEAKVPVNAPAIHAPRGFLFEWWAVFWDIFISRYKLHQGSMEPYDETMRVRQMLQQQQQQQQKGQSQSQSQLVNANNATNVRNPWVAEASAPTKQPVPKQQYGDNVGMVINSMNHQKQALVPTHDVNSLINSLINQNAQGSQGLPSGAHAATGVLNNMPLKGWPLTGRLPQQQGQLFGQNQMDGQLQSLNEKRRSQTEGQLQPSNERKRSQTEGQLQPPSGKMTKQPLVSGNANPIFVFSNSAGEVSMPNSPHNDKINIDDFLNYGALDGNDNSLLSRAGKEPEVDPSDGFTFLEIGSVGATSVNCCDILLDGKLVAVGGQDKKVTLWCTSSRECKASLDGHSETITDIRFSPSMLRLATSSHDKTVRIWDLENPGSSIRRFTGHTASVTSLDFHPQKEDLVCSCDENEIRYWSIKSDSCVKVSKGGANQVRFQRGVGKHLATVIGNSVSLLDLEHPQAPKHVLKGHGSNVQSICWDSSGDNLISVSEDSLKVWRIDSGGKTANCIHELSVSGKRFQCGVFHPSCPSLLVIGCHQSMELWNMAENKLMMAVEEPVSALAVSNTGLIASAGHNDVVKLWK